jgi:hypothetical protein
MMKLIRGSVSRQSAAVLRAGVLGGLLSLATMAWRGRADVKAAAAALNAPGQWIHGSKVLRRNAASPRYTLTGVAVHLASGFFWTALLHRLRSERSRRTKRNALVDVIAVTVLAAVVDLRVVPHRLSPGFQDRLRPASVALVYASYAAGLFVGLLGRHR